MNGFIELLYSARAKQEKHNRYFQGMWLGQEKDEKSYLCAEKGQPKYH